MNTIENNSQIYIIVKKEGIAILTSKKVEIISLTNYLPYGMIVILDSELISKQEMKDLLSKNWLTHDAMWFAVSVETLGIKKTNGINRKAAHNMAVIEAKRLSKVLNVVKLNTAQEIISFMDKTFSIIGGDYIKCDYKAENDHSIIFETKKCFAFEGVSKLGVISEYECGIFERIEGWFNYFKIDFTKEPDDLSCLMHKNGACFKKYLFNFPR